MAFLKLSNWATYRTAFHLSNYVWSIVSNWNHFARTTVGEQFVTAVDSISANMAEGWGRHFRRDKVKFYRYSQGSCKESLDWNEKAKVRGLLTDEEYKHIFSELEKIPKGLHIQIKFTLTKLKE